MEHLRPKIDYIDIFIYRSQVETISTFESMLLGDPFDFLSNVPQMLSRVPSCSLFRQLYRSNTMRSIFTKIGASEILLFYRVFPDKRATIRPNQRFDNCSCLRSDEVGKNIIRAAKEIIIKKQTNFARDTVDEKFAQMEKKVEARIEDIENKIGGIDNKLNLVLRKLERL